MFERLNKNPKIVEVKKEIEKERDNFETKKEEAKKAHINKVPKTTEERLEYSPKRKKQEENKEIAEELEDLFEDEYEYDDD